MARLRPASIACSSGAPRSVSPSDRYAATSASATGPASARPTEAIRSRRDSKTANATAPAASASHAPRLKVKYIATRTVGSDAAASTRTAVEPECATRPRASNAPIAQATPSAFQYPIGSSSRKPATESKPPKRPGRSFVVSA